MKNEERKCIAVIISKPERKYQEGLLRGICDSAFSHGMNVAVFATTLLEGTEEDQWGEQRIFDLIHYEKFEGVIYAVETFYGHQITKTLDRKLQEVHASGIPVVTIDGKVEGLPCFLNDDSNAVEILLEHLIREHDVKDIAYLTGRQGVPHAEKSLQTYHNTMARFHLPVKPGRTYYGDYWYNEADNFIRLLTESPDDLPEAIVCANEHMAAAAYRALHARGIFVPKHIRLGCTSNDAAYVPYLLVSENTMENAGRAACEALMAFLNGIPLPEEPQYILSKTELRTSVSCGCHKASEYNYSAERGVMVDSTSGYFTEFNYCRESLLSKEGFSSLFEEIDSSLKYISGFRSIYFCMCEGWNDPNLLIRGIRKNLFTDKMQLYFYRKTGPGAPERYIGEDRYFGKDDVFPDLFRNIGEPSVYLFRTLHCLDHLFGYVVLDNAQISDLYDYTFNFLLRDIANAIESQCRLQSVNYMYYKDIMTGLYNRNGFNTMLSTVLQDTVNNRRHLLVALADMNGLKHINDTYGHEEGDIAIKAAASLLKGQKIPRATYEKNFRIGGDEFVKIAVGNFTEQLIQEFKDSLYASAERFSDSFDKPFRIQMSIGICFKTIDKMDEIDALMAMADREMYQEKLRLKGSRRTQNIE